MKFRTRQAPSPTGYLHFGTARTMLYTQLLAKENNGVWYLRLEDTDRNRLQKGAVGSLLSSMKKLGLCPDEGVGVDNGIDSTYNSFYEVTSSGNYGPYIQSERNEKYQKYAQQLIDNKLAYWSYITPEDKELLVQIKNLHKKPINYFQSNIQKITKSSYYESSSIPNSEQLSKIYQSVTNGLNDPAKPDLKFKILTQESNKISIIDKLLGKIEFDTNIEEDFTILKSDGYPTYHLAHAVDDILMETSLVIRSQEWVSSIPKHIQLFNGLNFKLLNYMHVPCILGEKGGKKMSKRDGNVNIEDYLNNGYLAEAIVNYLAFLGWNPGSDKELYLSSDEFSTLDSNTRLTTLHHNLSNDFSVENMAKSPARFDISKLNWYNAMYIKMLPHLEYSNCVIAKLEDNNKQSTNPLPLLLDQNRAIIIEPNLTESDCIYNWIKPEEDVVKWKKSSVEESFVNLKTMSNFLENIMFKDIEYIEAKKVLQLYPSLQSFESCYRSIEVITKNYLKTNNFDFGSMLWPLRLALSGKVVSPSPFECMAVMSDEEILKRIKLTID